MKKSLLISALLLLPLQANAGLVNSDFETGDLTGWTTGPLSGMGSVDVVTSNSTDYSPGNWGGTPVVTTPISGSYMLAISAGLQDDWQSVSQTVTLAAGEKIGGSFFFDWGDYWIDTDRYIDGVKVEILDGTGILLEEWSRDGTDYCLTFCDDQTGQAGAESGWISWAFMAHAAGDYQVVYGVKNTGDDEGPNMTFGYFDAAQTVPEPASILLMGIGIAGLGMRKRYLGKKS